MVGRLAFGRKRPDELLAGRNLQPFGPPSAVIQFDLFIASSRCADRQSILQGQRLGGARHHQSLGVNVAWRGSVMGRGERRLRMAMSALMGSLVVHTR